MSFRSRWTLRLRHTPLPLRIEQVSVASLHQHALGGQTLQGALLRHGHGAKLEGCR